MIEQLDLNKIAQEAIDKNPQIFEKLTWLSFSELVRLQEINAHKIEGIRDEMEYMLTNGEPQNIKVKIEWKKVQMNGYLINLALEKKYDELFENTKF
ncbi:hypothetical protein [Salinimicrobium xinjiangense]|uniref:hypothetical protein n=1 Tax=Salinimicrobium xinjiangense TaxID=438596 RepID=UPI00041AF7AE|nr:hypothetical protein [Salinimicrobium xinjiangense]